MIYVAGSITISKQLLEQAIRDEYAFNHPPPGWTLPDDYGDDWDDD